MPTWTPDGPGPRLEAPWPPPIVSYTVQPDAPSVTLFSVPCPWAGSSAARASASRTVSAIRWLVSTLPPATADGARAATSEPAGARTAIGAYVPELDGTSGGISTRTAKQHAERVTAIGQLTLPTAAGAVPAKSISTASPATVTATR